jgi:hypothetical protein
VAESETGRTLAGNQFEAKNQAHSVQVHLYRQLRAFAHEVLDCDLASSPEIDHPRSIRITGKASRSEDSLEQEELALDAISVRGIVSHDEVRTKADRSLVTEHFRDKRAVMVSGSYPRRDSLKKHRLEILHAFKRRRNMSGMKELASQLRLDPSALYGMVRSDARRYGETTLTGMLKAIGCSSAEWDGNAKPSSPQ